MILLLLVGQLHCVSTNVFARKRPAMRKNRLKESRLNSYGPVDYVVGKLGERDVTSVEGLKALLYQSGVIRRRRFASHRHVNDRQ